MSFYVVFYCVLSVIHRHYKEITCTKLLQTDNQEVLYFMPGKLCKQAAGIRKPKRKGEGVQMCGHVFGKSARYIGLHLLTNKTSSNQRL